MLYAIHLPQDIESWHFSVDVFLVANNEQEISDLTWLDRHKPETSVQRALAPKLFKLCKDRNAFVIFDGGKTASLLAGPKNYRYTAICRTFDEEQTERSSQYQNGVKVSSHITNSATTSTATVGCGYYPISDHAANSKTGFSFNQSGSLSLTIHDINGYLKSWAKQATNLRETVGLTSATVPEVESALRSVGAEGAPVICLPGKTNAKSPNIVALPPTGVVAHYQLHPLPDGWHFKFIENLKAK